MPRLTPYQSPVDKLQPSDRGIEANAMAGRRIGHFYNEAGELISNSARAEARAAGDVAQSVDDIGQGVKIASKMAEEYQDRQAISKGVAEGEKMLANEKSAWNDTVKEAAKRDPNDPTVAAKYREGLEERLQQFKEAYSGSPGAQQWAENYTQKIRHHMFESSTSDMGELAAVAAKRNIETLKTTASNTAHSNPDFHTAGFLLGNIDAQVNAIIDASPNLKGVAAEKLRAELTKDMRRSIVEAGATGAVMRSGDPEKTADEWAKRFPDMIDGAAISKAARQQIRAKREDERWDRTQERIDKQEKNEAASDGLLKQIFSDDPNERAKVSVRDIINNPLLDRRTKEHFIGVVQRESEPDAPNLTKISADTTTRLLERIRATDGSRLATNDDIYKEFIAGRLNRADFKFLNDEFKNQRTPEGERWSQGANDFIKAVKPAIDKSNPLMGKIDPDGPMNLYRFQTDLERKKAEYIRTGKDPHDLIDPSKPDFFGKPENVARYQKTMAESARDAAARLTGKTRGNLTDPGSTITGQSVTDLPPPAPRKPGESPDAYLKRNGIK